MGLPKNTLDFILDNIKDLHGQRLLELGNQQIRSDVDTKSKTGKEYFANLGYKHTSIDLNGKDGALKLDLSEPINTVRGFGIVTNCGTSCHVSNETECFRNIHNFCRVGGMMIHVLPNITGKWSGTEYSGEFMENLAFANKYKIIKNGTIDGKFGKLRAAALVKTGNVKFKMKPMILWISDGVKWGFDIRAKLLAELLPNYDHRILPCAYMKREGVAEIIKTAGTDVIMAMNPIMLEHLKDRSSKIVVTLPSYRCLEDWRRWSSGNPAPEVYRKVYGDCKQEDVKNIV